MKFFFLALSLTLIAYSVNAQAIRFQKDSLPVILSKAKEHSKPVMVLLDGPLSKKQNEQMQKRNLFLRNAEIGKIYNQNFLCYRAAFGSKEFKQLSKYYKVSSFPLFVFLTRDGGEIYRSFGFLGDAERYISMADTVLKKLTGGDYIAAYDLRYSAGERSRAFLKNYINERIKFGYYNNSEIIDEYVQFLTLKEINTYKEMLFIIQAGPVVGSKAYQLSFMHKATRDSVYKTIPKGLAIAINNRTINNSFEKAIATKDRSLAYQAGSFVSGSHGANYTNGSRAQTSRMLGFFKSIKDTASFLRQAGYFYDQQYMRMSVDSAKRKHQLLLDSLKKNREKLSLKYKSSGTARLIYSPRPVANATALALNNAAWDVYLTGTRNESYLNKALSWSRRSLAIEPSYYAYDTYAHLLDLLGFYAEAASAQNKAVSLAKQKKLNPATVKKLEAVLKRMKAKNV